MIRVKSHKRTPAPTVLGIGDHLVKIESVTPCFNTDNVNVPWIDRTPQVAIKYVCNGKFITQWISLKGYCTKEQSLDLEAGCDFVQHPISGIEYAVKDGKRIENEDKTKQGYLILAHLSYCSGVPNDSEIELSDLVGRELLIRVGTHEGQIKVIKVFKKR